MNIVVGVPLLALGSFVLFFSKLFAAKTLGLVRVSSLPLEAWSALCDRVKRGYIASLTRLDSTDSISPRYQTAKHEHSNGAEEEEQNLGTISRLISSEIF